jgi:GAF domain-containing protein
MTNEEILAQLRHFAEDRSDSARLQLEAVRLLKENFDHFDWVGIYTLDNSDELVLGPFLGKPSPHTRIPVGKGICGAAVRQRETVIVDDVNADERYLACSIETKSEIVTPIFKDGNVVGEIDIDSHTPAAFKESDRNLLEAVAEILANSFP